MFLCNLRLANFRNYQELDLSLQDGMTVFRGANGQGKSNLLEAVYFLSLLRSFRTHKVSDLKLFSTPFFKVQGNLHKSTAWLGEEAIQIVVAEKRTLQINHQPVNKASDFINRFFCVALTPQDIDLIKGPPSARRRFANILAGQIVPGFLNHLIDFSAALRHRNVVLRNSRKYGSASLQAYNRLLVAHGVPIVLARAAMIEKLKRFLQTTAAKLGERDNILDVRYDCSMAWKKNKENQDVLSVGPAELAELYSQQLEREQSRDEELGATRFGPHRDDLVFFRNQKPLANFASEGQMRLFVLALHLAASTIVKETDSTKPLVLLVDDIFGELDQTRRARLFECLQEYRQCLLACTQIPAELAALQPMVLTVKDGLIDSQE